jgi:hypothetical protein
MDPELKAYLDQAFSQIGNRLGALEQRVGALEARVGALEEAVTQTRILVEGQHNDTRQVAEGVIGTNERLDSLREEMGLQFEHLRSLISPPYSDLNRRMKMLESWRERTERDPVELVRERFGRPKAT